MEQTGPGLDRVRTAGGGRSPRRKRRSRMPVHVAPPGRRRGRSQVALRVLELLV